MSKLLELAERVEKAEGPDRELDNTIALEVFEFLRNLTRTAEGGWLHPAHGKVCPAAEYTASLDAALTLVPDGANLMVVRDERGNCWAEIDTEWQHEGKTLALALCNAALRARAAMETTR